MASLEKQYDFADTSKCVKRGVAEMNKYVGYRSENLIVTQTETQGWLKKLVKEVKMIQKSIFPLRYYKYRRDIGTLEIYDKQNGTLKHMITENEIKSVQMSNG